MSSDFYDALIIGAGHNGLVCAHRLARAGLKVKVLESRPIAGGAAVTEEFHPGFRNSTAAYAARALDPRIVGAMALERHGLAWLPRRAQHFAPQPDGRYLLTGRGPLWREIATLSAGDAANCEAFTAEIEGAARLIASQALRAPPSPGARGLLATIAELMKLASLGASLRRFALGELRALLDLFTRSASDYLDRWFEDDRVRGFFGFPAIFGAYAGPMTPGTAYGLVHNRACAAGFQPQGGMGAITQAMARACAAAGVEIVLGTSVESVVIERGRAVGLRTAGGAVLRARRIIANINPGLLYGRLVPEETLPPEFAQRMRQWKCGSGLLRINLALSRLPRFTAIPGAEAGDHHTARILLLPGLLDLERGYAEARAEGLSRTPAIEMMIPSVLDDTLAPRGAHVASLACQYVSPDLASHRRDEAADLMIRSVEAYAPGFAESVIACEVLSPRDLEERFGLTGGDIFHGALAPGQLYWARPMLGYADYRGPLGNLYLCGAGGHPGGGVTGAPGHNAAGAVLEDFRRAA